MYNNILVPLDGSAFAETALPHAGALAAKFGCKITLVKVFETPHVYQAIDKAAGVLEDIHLAAIKDATDYLEAQQAKLTAEGLSVEVDFIEGGNVAAMILEAIEESGADLVVMSTHGRSGLDRWRFGSVAERVARHTSVPVVLIRPKKVD
jgi:nucleotide-binding universal stress UspA family protein